MKTQSTYTSRVSTDRSSKSAAQPSSFSSSLLSVGSSLKTAGSRAGRGFFQAVSTGYEHLTSDTSDKEVVLFVKFSQLELRGSAGVHLQSVLLLGYETGFQVWDLQDCHHIHELVSRRDGSVRCAKHTPCLRHAPPFQAACPWCYLTLQHGCDTLFLLHCRFIEPLP